MQLIDAGMVGYAAWHALAGRIDRPLTYQVPRMLRRMLAERPDTFVLFWNGHDLWKRRRWKAYRDRPELWEEAGRRDFQDMLAVLTALGVIQYRAEGWEADEALATFVHRFDGSERIWIRSDDKDFFQLLSGTTRMLGRVRGRVRYGDVKDILGVTPTYVADYLALVGDTADGLPRIVPTRTAIDLIRTRGHVRDWIDRDLRVDESTKRKIEKGREQLRLNLELADLGGGTPLPRFADLDPLLDGWGDLELARSLGRKADISWLAAESLTDDYDVLRRWGGRTRQRLGL